VIAQLPQVVLPQQRVLRSIAQPLAAAVVTDGGLLLTAFNGTLMAAGQVTRQVLSPSGQVLSPTAEPRALPRALPQATATLGATSGAISGATSGATSGAISGASSPSTFLAADV